jgi:hypothetical protein
MIGPWAIGMMLDAKGDGEGIRCFLAKSVMFPGDGVPAEMVDLRGIPTNNTTKIGYGLKPDGVVLLDNHR